MATAAVTSHESCARGRGVLLAFFILKEKFGLFDVFSVATATSGAALVILGQAN